MKTKHQSTDNLPPIEFIVYGEPASKSNNSSIVRRGKRLAIIKSKKARSFSDIFREQCPRLEKMFEGDLRLELTIYYASRRPDLDHSLVKDLMQFDRRTGISYIYRNDRQIKSEAIEWAYSPLNPRCHIRISPYEVPAHLLENPPKQKKAKA